MDAKSQTNWMKCCLCQQETKDVIISPDRNPAKTDSCSISSLARNILLFQLFRSINALPIRLDPARLDDGSGIEESLRNNKARYHASCKLLFNNTSFNEPRKGPHHLQLTTRTTAAVTKSLEGLITTKLQNVSSVKNQIPKRIWGMPWECNWKTG